VIGIELKTVDGAERGNSRPVAREGAIGRVDGGDYSSSELPWVVVV
jgi:hypothetical protein